MSDGGASPKIKIEPIGSVCVSCHRIIYPNELYGYNGMCSQCCELEGHGEHNGG
jgi:hypothetical protein